MADYDNTNTGALFRAKEKQSEKHPDYTGSINIEGKEYWLSGWLKESKLGQKYFSLAVKPKDAPKAQEKSKPTKFDDIESDIPF